MTILAFTSSRRSPLSCASFLGSSVGLLAFLLTACDPSDNNDNTNDSDHSDSSSSNSSDDGTSSEGSDDTDSSSSDDSFDTQQDDEVGDEAGDNEPDGSCDVEQRWGGFEVELYDDILLISGTVNNAPLPSNFSEVVAQDNECLLWKRKNFFCDPPCGPSEICGPAGECIPYPVGQSLGTVSVDGLGETVSMDPIEPGARYSDTSKSIDDMVPGQRIHLHSSGGTYDPINLYGYGIEKIEFADDGDWVVFKDKPITANWIPAKDNTKSHVIFHMNIDQHGATPVSLLCTFPDTGSGVVSGELISTMFSSGISGFPNGGLTRRTADNTNIGSGCADFSVVSNIDGKVHVDGFTPCKEDSDCPPGQTCNKLVELCE